jgi:uncharacterized coiled-coil DUF342 family protein
MAKLSKASFEKFNKVLLRMLPILPAPEIYDLFKELSESKKSVNQKIEKAYNSLRETSSLIDELQMELNERTERVKELKESYEKYAKLAQIEEDKVKPLLDEIEKTVGKGKGKERLWSLLISLIVGIIIFILGIWLGPKIISLFG